MSFHPALNCIVGPNGAGKTNLMDALYFSCFTKSYFTSQDQFVLREGAPFLRVVGRIETEDGVDELVVKMPAGGRKEISVNAQDLQRLSDLIGRYPAVMIAPDDNQLILGGSEGRRKFLDGCLSMLDHQYLTDLLHYLKLLKRRNALLKQFLREGRQDLLVLEGIDVQLAPPGDRLRSARTAFIGRFTAGFEGHYRDISGGREVPGVTYQSDDAHMAMADLLLRNRSADLAAGRSLVGPHRDDLLFTLDEKPLKTVGSQGQQKSFLVALKLAQYDLIRKENKVAPFLFLDDLFDKFDAQRVEHLVTMIADGRFGQVFITDTHEGRMSALLKKHKVQAGIIRVQEGMISYG